MNIDYIKDMYFNNVKRTGFFKHYYTLFSIVEGLEVQNSFEFGTGISTMTILEAIKLTGGKHTSNDIRDIDKTGLSNNFLSDNNNIWNYIQKNSQQLTVDELKNVGPFDFVLHDGSHIPNEVEKDLNKIIPCMKLDSILLIHDTENDEFKETLKTAAKNALANINHEMITLPYSFGLTIVRIKEDFGNGKVEPKWIK